MAKIHFFGNKDVISGINLRFSLKIAIFAAMKLVRRPWVWFVRFRHRRGYGVHSPFAFDFINDVVYEQAYYYAYQTLNLLHPWWVRWGGLYPLACRRFLFRLGNYVHPKTFRVLGERPIEQAYLKKAVPTAQWVDNNAEFLFVTHEQMKDAQPLLPQMPEQGVMVIEGIHTDGASRVLWRKLREDSHSGVTFDLYTYGIIFFNPHLHKQHYIVNFP